MESAFLNVISHSGVVALGVLILLLGCSIFVWALLFTKWKELSHTGKINQSFLDLFEQEPELAAVRQQVPHLPDSALKRIFALGEEEIAHFAQQLPHAGYRFREELLDMLERLFESHIIHEEKKMGHGQTVLATISTTAPFIGLFGTVVGIIDTFGSIAHLQSVELTVVAPGISEALIATAAGLFAAIPATIGFNVFRSMIREMVESMDYFALQLLKRLQLQLMVMDEKKA